MAKKIGDAELIAILNTQYRLANVELNNTKVSSRRIKNQERYRGELYGNERDGRSRVVDWSVYDVIESTKPALLKIFAGTDTIAEFTPVSPEDEESAQQATDYCNFVFMKDNDGFNLMSTWMHDGLLSINGYVKITWEEQEKTETKEWEGQDQEQITRLLQELQTRYDPARGGKFEILEQEEHLDGGVPTYDLTVKCTTVKKFAKIINCAPEDCGKSPGAMDMDEAPYSYHRPAGGKSVTELLEMGFPKEKVLEAAKASAGNNTDREHTTRSDFEDDVTGRTLEAIDESMQVVTYTEHYIRMDYDGAGKAQYRVVKTGGDNNTVIFENEEISECPLVEWTPIPLPYQSHGMALAEPVIPLTEIKTTLQRQMLDNFYCINNSRTILNQNLANENTIGDLLNSRPNAIIRANDINAVKPYETKPLGSEPFVLLEYMDSLQEKRTGVTSYNQGLDADSLNKTATGIQQIMGAAQERQMMVARHFASALKRLFGKLLRMTIKHQDIPRVLRLRNKWVSVDPTYWNANMDANITVGLGTGSKEQQLVHLTALIDRQVTQLLPIGAVQPQHILHTATKMVENMGFKDTDGFLPTEEEIQQQQEMAQQQPDPAQAQAAQQAQVEQQKMQMEGQKMAMQQQSEQQRFSFEQEKAAADLQQKAQIEREKIASNERIQMAKIEADMQSKREQGEMMAKASEKPSAMVQFSGEEVLSQVATTLQSMAQDQSQALQAGVQAMSAAVEAIAAAVAQLNAPRQVQVVRDASGKMAGATVQ